MSDQSIEQEIVAKGLTAPRITPDDIAANISSEHYFTAADGIRGANDLECESGDPLTLLTFLTLALTLDSSILDVGELTELDERLKGVAQNLGKVRRPHVTPEGVG